MLIAVPYTAPECHSKWEYSRNVEEENVFNDDAGRTRSFGSPDGCCTTTIKESLVLRHPQSSYSKEKQTRRRQNDRV